MDELIVTEAGLLKEVNIQYLYSQKVFNKDLNIRYQEIKNSSFVRPVQLWSMFCLIKEDITNTTGVKDLNAIVDIMREGNNTERMYPKVDDIIRKGSQLVFEAYENQGSSKKKKSYTDFDI